MNFKAIFLILSFMAVSGAVPARARTYQEDLNSFVNALKFNQLSQRRLRDFQDPSVGNNAYRLSESRAPWAGNYFAMMDGGVAYRWQEGRPASMVNAQAREYFLSMTQEQLDHLSPAEKYDLSQGRYELPFTGRELQVRGPQRPQPVQDWEGFCNGVRCAGILTPEPKYGAQVKNADGLEINFLPADLKALAGVNYFYVEKYAQLGAPSRKGQAENQPNAAIFDLALRYFLSEKKKAFVIDSHLGSEIWNESVIGYRRTLGGPVLLSDEEKKTHPWAVAKREVEMTLETLAEIDIRPSNSPTKAQVAAGALHRDTKIRYVLYVNREGKALDGAWISSGDERGVDFAWFGGGRGFDARYADQSGNPHLEDAILRDLMRRASRPPSCQKVFLAD